MQIKALLIDHFDSFTANIYRWLESHFTITLCSYPNFPTNLDNYHLIILSPGPGTPNDYPATQKLIQEQLGKTYLFGICLGFQMLALEQSLEIFQLPNPLHGKTSSLTCASASPLLTNITWPMTVAHYHSLAIRPQKRELITALDKGQEFVMVIEDREQKFSAVQFHPESFLSTNAQQLKENLYNLLITSSGYVTHPSSH